MRLPLMQLDDFITSDQENSYIAVDISFGSVGYSRCLTRKFDQVKCICNATLNIIENSLTRLFQ